MIGSCSSKWPRSAGGNGRGTRQGERALDQRDEVAEVEGLGQVVEGAALGRAHRGEQRVLRAHHDDRQMRPALLDARQQVEGVLVGQHDVDDRDVAGAVLDPAPERRGRGGGVDLPALARERARDHGANPAVVVGEDHGRLGHALLLLRPPPGRRCARRAAGPGRWCRAACCRTRSRRRGRRRSWRPATARARCPSAWSRRTARTGGPRPRG